MPQQTKILVSPYDYEKVFEFLIKKGKQDFGESFDILKNDKALIMKLIAYFLRDDFMCNEYQIAIYKGILLSGPIGCGKTTLMHLMKYLNNQNHSIYLMKSCRDVSFEFIKDGYDVVHRYTRQSFYKNGTCETPKHYCFDDLGTENNLKYYGNECNIMAEILLSRYDLFVSRKLITHLTTNLSASEIEAAYGNRLRSRLREQFNLIAFNNNALDKRI